MFNPQHLITAFELYNSQFDRWNWNQRDLFWRQVVGFVQRFLPANCAMDFAQGLYNRVENKERSKRSFNFTLGDAAIFPLSFGSFSGLGYEGAVLAGGGAWALASAGLWNCAVRGVVAIFKTYVEQKQRSWENYAVRVDPQQSRLLYNSVM